MAFALVACGVDDNGRADSGPTAWLVELEQQPEYRAACAATPGCAEAQQSPATPTEPIWRVQVLREASGEVVFGLVDTVGVPSGDGIPPGPATGDYLLVGLDENGEPVDGRMIRFPRAMRIEFRDRTVAPLENELQDKRVDTIGYLRADSSIRRLEIQDQSATAIAAIEAPAPEIVHRTPRPEPFAFISQAYAATPLSGLPPHCAHVRVLEGEADRAYAGALALTEDVAMLKVPGPFQLAAIKAALNRVTPLLCGAVGRIAFANFEELQGVAAGAVLQAGEGDIVMINSASFPETALENKADPAQQRTALWERLQLQAVLIHESGHSVEALLNGSGADPGLYGGTWTVSARRRTAATLTNARLRKGFGEEWRRVHNSFVDVDWARAHSISGMVIPEADNKVVSGGFMTSYGSNIWWDDIAEYISQIYMGPVVRDNGFKSDDLACESMRDWGRPSVPSGLAAAYTKVLLLRDLGLVRPADAKTCLGDSLGLQDMPTGLHFWIDGELKRSFRDNLSAGIHTEPVARNKVFTLVGEGQAGFGGELRNATLTVRLDLASLGKDIEEVSWPRGVYELGLLGDNNVQLRLDGAKAGNFDATDGFVLVSEATNQRIAGSIVLQRVIRLQAPIPVPERYQPPLIVRFKIER